MSDLDQENASLALTDDDELCEWYRRPGLGGQAASESCPDGLCEECTSLTQKMLGVRPDSSTSHSEEEDIYDGYYTQVPLGVAYTFQKPYSQLRGDADFCALCRAIEDSVAITQEHAAGDHPTQIPPGSHLRLQPADIYDLVYGYHVGVGEDENTSETDSETSFSDTPKGQFKSNRTWESIGFLEVQVQETEPVPLGDNLSSSSAIRGRPIVTVEDTSLRRAVNWRNMTQILHWWLRECDSVHDVCRDHRNSRQGSTDSPASPSRLLEIQQVNGHFHIRLVAGNENRPRYTALSHRWGDYTSIRTTTDNIESYRNEINFESLSLTLQQAVQITYATGVRHLWVDCLCIIQEGDDLKDWKLEAPKMGSIYASAYFTIAASAFEDAGCFPHKFSENRRVTIDIRPGLELNIYPRSKKFPTWSLEKEPLQKRGWTLQERFLSDRILHCSRYEYYWLCREQRLCAGADSARFLNPPCGSVGDLYNATLLLSYSWRSQRVALDQWYLLLSAYSSRQLTQEKDKLIAIKGLADIFQRWIDSSYLYGLWECDLACGLVWQSSRGLSNSGSGWETKKSEPEESRSWRTRPTRAPSWSWASVDGSQQHRGSGITWTADRLELPLSDFVYVKATVASDDEHRSCLGGEFSAGPWVLKISGRLSKAYYSHESEYGVRIWQIKREIGPQAFEFVADDPNFDTDEYLGDAESSSLYVLPIVKYMGLVISPVSDDLPLYRRVGASDFNTTFRPRYAFGGEPREESEASTAGTADSGTANATVQTDDRVIEALGYTIKTDTEAFGENADGALCTAREAFEEEEDDAALYTASEAFEDDLDAELNTEDESGRTGNSTKYVATPEYAAELRARRKDYMDQFGWLEKEGASETIFLC